MQKDKDLHLKKIIKAKQYIVWLFCLIVFNSISVQAKDSGLKKHYSFNNERLHKVLIDIAKLHDRHLIMRSNTKLERLVTIECFCTLQTVLTDLLKTTSFSFQLSQNKNILIFPHQKRDNRERADKITDNSYERILVTGYRQHSKSILRSSSAVTVFNKNDFMQEGLPSTAEMLKHVPGFWVEDSGGEVNNNVAPRGLRGGEGFRFISIMEDGLPISYDGIWSDFFQRQDTMISQIETVRGGSSGVLSVNGPAAVVNYVSKDGRYQPYNEISFKQGLDYGYSRLDTVLSGKMNDNWTYAFGGYYRVSDGIRETNYIADQGGQLKAVFAYEKDNWLIKLISKHINDKTSFYSPIVLHDHDNPKSIASLSSSHGTLLSNSFSNFQSLSAVQNGEKGSFDIGDGQQTDLFSQGFIFEQTLSDAWHYSLNIRYSDMSNSMLALMNLGNDTIFSAEDLLESDAISSFITNNEHLNAHSASLINIQTGDRVADPQRLNNNGLLTFSYPLYANYQQHQWLGKGQVSFEFDKISGILGYLYANSDYGELPLDKWLGQYLIDVRHQPNRFDIVALDRSGKEVAKLTEQGALSYSGPAYLAGSGVAKSHSLFGQIEIDISERLTIDLGLRREALSLRTISFTDAESLLGAKSILTRHKSNYSFSKEGDFLEVAWSLGANYTIGDVAIFANTAKAFEMPRLTSFANAIGWSNNVDNVPTNVTFERPVELRFQEVGVRLSKESFNATAIMFETNFDPLSFTVFQGADTNKTIFIDTHTTGLEFEFFAEIDANVSVSGTGVWQNARFTGIPKLYEESIFNGNQITRTPELQFNITPTYSWNENSAYINYHYIGKRFSDVANLKELPSYHYVDIGVSSHLSPDLSVNFNVKNVLNTLGLTEGNPRTSLEYSTSDYYYARPIFGRSISVSLQYTF